MLTLIGSMGGSGSTAKLNSTTSIRIVVAGDQGTGKSSLIIAAATEAFPANVPPVLPPTRLPEDMLPDRTTITVIDTSSSLENRGKLADELKSADAVILTYACDQPSTFERLSTFWLPELRRLEVKVPVVVAGCKLDLPDEQQAVILEQVMSPTIQQFREIETCIECSAYKHIQIPDVFYYAQQAVIYPTAPLLDPEAKILKPRCVRALKRIFILCDRDRDGALSDAELNDFQVKCFNKPLLPSEIVGVKRVVQEQVPEGVHENGITLTGFLFLHALFVEQGRLGTTWTVLRKFGYNNDIRLGDDQLLPPIKRTPDQSAELTNEAVEFLRGVFSLFDIDGDGALNAHELEDVFSTAPESPWSEAPYVNATEKNASGGLSLDGFLAEWALMTFLDPVLSVENLIYVGYAGDPSSAVRVTRRRRVDREMQHSDRNVFQCFVFGPKEAGKSSLLHSFVGRPFSEVYTPTTEERYTVNIVDEPGGTKKTLILREVPEDMIGDFLIHKDALATCDIAVFVHDSSNESSWKRATGFLVDVARHGESTGYEVPILIVAAKDDLDPYPTATQDPYWTTYLQNLFSQICQDKGIEAPIPISAKLDDFNNIFRRIVRAAEHPHQLLPPNKRTPDQSVELTTEAVEFLRGVFSSFDIDGDGALDAQELEDVFSTAPESPWSEAPYVNAAEKNASGGLSLDGFLALWALMTLLDPVLSVKNLVIIGYAGSPLSAVGVHRRRSVDREKQHSDQNVFQCFVFGPKEAGKSSLLQSFVGRPFSEVYTPTTEERYTVNNVDELGGTKKTLILREIPEDMIEDFLIQKDALATCDIAVFVYDSSNECSWMRATELLVEVASHGKSTGYEFPCLVVAAKDDLDPYPTAIQDSTRISDHMGIEAPIPVSTKLGDFNDIFRRIVTAAEHPHLSIPETEGWKTGKQYHGLLNSSLMVVSGCFGYESCCSIGQIAWR